MCELEWPHGVGAAARRSSAGLAIQRCSSRQRLPPLALLSCSGAWSIKATHRHALGARMHTSSRCWTHGGCLRPPRTGSAGATTCWRRSSANYCQASARRDMTMGARMCAQGTSGLLRDAWLGSASACEFSVIFVLKSLAGVRTRKRILPVTL